MFRFPLQWQDNNTLYVPVCRVALTFDSRTIFPTFAHQFYFTTCWFVQLPTTKTGEWGDEHDAGNTKSNMMRLWPANYSPCHVFSLYSDHKPVATHGKINKTNRDVLKTKNVLPKNSMKLFITIGIMIPQQDWDVSPGWDPYPHRRACCCCCSSHTY